MLDRTATTGGSASFTTALDSSSILLGLSAVLSLVALVRLGSFGLLGGGFGVFFVGSSFTFLVVEEVKRIIRKDRLRRHFAARRPAVGR